MDEAQAKGLLNPTLATTKFHLSRHAPTADIGYFVLRYWIISWDLRNQAPHVQELIPHPCVNVVFEQHRAAVYGVTHRRSAHRLDGAGRVFGIKFKPGGFRPFVRRPVSSFTNTAISLMDGFGVDCRPVETAIAALDDPAATIARAEQFLHEHLPDPDPRVELVNGIVAQIGADRTIVTVDQVAQQFKVHKRTLQRLFREYVGVSPKWVIKLYRLHEAAEQVAAGVPVAWSNLALELGYFDQAHFINDFKRIVGSTPADYAKRLAQPDAS
jgi:AraC-like DNA-binding protein